ncbi:hypothetical protein TrVFT333_010701 [Trichoderma virens FT-333]|nr:hypothetical protein TrVFT333_010701 [Trichoderma virens FT-333]
MAQEQSALQAQKTHGRRTWHQAASRSRATTKTFEFIASHSVGRPHPNVRKLIRSHVMLGKNIKRRHAEKVEHEPSQVAEVVEFSESGKTATSTVSTKLTISANQSQVAADAIVFIVPRAECGNQTAIVSFLAIASP